MSSRGELSALTSAGRLAALALAAVISIYSKVDPDLWGHLRFGLDALRDRRLVAADPYSFTRDMPWVNHEWLSEVLLAASYRMGGVSGIILMKAALLVSTFVLLGIMARRVAETHRWWLLAAGFLCMNPAANTIRPQLWTLLALAVLNWILWSSPPRLFLLPLLFALWANLHGGWIVGVGVAGAWTLGRFLDTRVPAAVVWPLTALGLAVLATAANPYGIYLWSFLWSTVGVTRAITEWRPLWQQADASFFVLWVVAWAMVLGTGRIIGLRAITWAGALPVVWLGVMSAFVTRLMPLFAVVALGSCAATWKAGEPTPQLSRPRGFVAIDTAVILAVSLMFLYPASRCLTIAEPWIPDLEAATTFAPATVQGRLVLPFDWGEYAIWHWSPRLRVSIDGRRETVYSGQTVDLQAGIAYGQTAGLEFLGRVRPEYVWLQNDFGARTADWLKGNGYLIDVKTDRSFIARRGDLPPLRQGPPASSCFP
jgi:hypothetical protein